MSDRIGDKLAREQRGRDTLAVAARRLIQRRAALVAELQGIDAELGALRGALDGETSQELVPRPASTAPAEEDQ